MPHDWRRGCASWKCGNCGAELVRLFVPGADELVHRKIPANKPTPWPLEKITCEEASVSFVHEE